MSFQLREEIKGRGVQVVDGIDITLIEIMAISLSVLRTSGKGKGFQSVLINRLAPKAICSSVDVIMIGCTFVVLRITSGLDISPYNIRSQRLVTTKILMVVEVERG